MGISKGKASSLMDKAKLMNERRAKVAKKNTARFKKKGKHISEAHRKGLRDLAALRRQEKRDAAIINTAGDDAGRFRSLLSAEVPEGYASGGMARVKGTPPAQVKGFTYNDNGGEGTF